MQRGLFIGAHLDDIELGCGATITKYSASWEIKCIILSANQENPKSKMLISEMYKSMKELGVQKSNIIVGSFRTRHFDQSRQEIRDFLIKVKEEFNTDAVFTHAVSDIHQDHVVTCQEAQRIFREKSIFGFEIQRSSPYFYPRLYIILTNEDVKAKIRALSQYETYKGKNVYFKPEVIRSLLVTRGVFVGQQFAEGFEVYNLVL